MTAVARRAGVGRAALVALGANLLTHGTLWAVWPYSPLSYVETLVVAETCVWLVEAAVFAGLGVLTPGRALGWALVANGITIAIGLVWAA